MALYRVADVLVQPSRCARVHALCSGVRFESALWARSSGCSSLSPLVAALHFRCHPLPVAPAAAIRCPWRLPLPSAARGVCRRHPLPVDGVLGVRDGGCIHIHGHRCVRGEGWGRPHVEAMACGLPVIATNWSGNTEVKLE